MKEFADSINTIASDLNALSIILVEKGICNNNKPLSDAAYNCTQDSDDATWRYKIENLEFNIEDMGHCIPHNACFLNIIFSIDVSGKYYKFDSVSNPLNHLELNIEISGLSDDIETPNKNLQLYSAWHLDKHISIPTDGATKFIHPEFHFSFGGNRMLNQKLDFGSTLILPSPRFTHPPLDGILGIDFIIQNYIRFDVHKELTQSQEYLKILKNSQYRIWRPYHCAIADFWKEPNVIIDDTISARALLPNLA